MSHERKTVGHWATAKIQAIEAFTEHAKRSGIDLDYLTDREWRDAFAKWRLGVAIRPATDEKALLAEWLTLWLNSGPDPEGIESLVNRTKEAIR